MPMTETNTLPDALVDRDQTTPLQGLDALRQLARARLQAQRHDDAREVCRNILATHPGDAETLNILAQCRFDLSTFLAESGVSPKRGARPRRAVPKSADSEASSFENAPRPMLERLFRTV